MPTLLRAPGSDDEISAKLATSFVTRGALELMFDTDDGPRKVVATERPLGLTFDQESAAVVAHVKEHALDLGIRTGWKLTHFDGIPAPRDFDALQAEFIKRSIQKLSGPPALALVFQTEANETLTVVASELPIGLTFYKQFPAKVRSAMGHGKSLGVRPGWHLVSFGIVKVDDCTDYDSFFSQFRIAACAALERSKE